MRNAIVAGKVVWALAAVLWLAGCEPDSPQKAQLNAGYSALRFQDYKDAMADAEAFLRATPAGPGSAEAYYLEGRVYEQGAETAAGEAVRNNLNAARTAYSHGLGLNSSLRVQALLHAGLANIAYHLDDYGTAVREWGASYPAIEPADAKAWVLYRIGLCQQRLGWFPQADRSFQMVRAQYPNSEAATRAAAHEGATAFYVQVGAFEDFVNANRAVASLRTQGLTAQVVAEPNRETVRVGPIPTYAEARAMQTRLMTQYTDAEVIP